MIYGVTPMSQYAIAELPAAYDNSGPSFLRLLLEDPDANFKFLLVARPGSDYLTEEFGESKFPYPQSSQPMGTIDPNEDFLFDDRTIRLSDSGFITKPTDIPADKNFEARLLSAFNFETSVPIPGSVGAIDRTSLGFIRINNSDQEVSDLIERAWEGREVEILIGGTLFEGRANEKILDFDEYSLVFKGVVNSVSADLDSITLNIEDFFAKLENIEIQENLYAGTGGFEGDSEIEGLPKPLGYGRIKNAPTILVDDANLVYQYHDGSVEQIEEVRDRGVVLTLDVDTTDLVAWTPTPGQYATDKSRGLLRLGAKPDGSVTLDFKGDNTGGYIDSTPDIVRRIVSTKGKFDDPSDFELTSFNTFTNDGEIGYFVVSGGKNIADVVDELVVAADGWVSFTRDGLMRMGNYIDIHDPFLTPVVQYDDDEVIQIRKDPAPTPIWRARIGYDRIWSVQDKDALAAAVSETNRTRFSERERFIEKSSLNERSINWAARNVEFSTFFCNSADADTIATAFLNRCKGLCKVYGVSLAKAKFQSRIGDIIKVNSNKLKINDRICWIIGFNERAEDRIVDLLLMVE